MIKKDRMFYKFALYGFLKNLRFFEPFIILIFRDGGLSFFQIGILYAVRDLATNILEIPTGVYADSFGRRKSMIIAFSSYIVAFIIFFLFPQFSVYIIAMLFFALGEAFRSGTHKALILEYLMLNKMTHLKVAYYGRTRAASQLGSAVNSLIAAGLVFYTGNYRYMFIAATLPYVLDLLNLMTYPKELDGELARIEKGAMGKQIKQTVRGFAAIFKDQYAMRGILNSAGFSAFFKTTKDYLQPILKTFAVAMPVFVLLDETRRSALIIGGVYFLIYLLTSYASRSAADVGNRFVSLSRAINVTFFMGAGFLLIAGISAWQNLTLVSILVFLGLHVVQNLRRPMNVAFISEQISNKVMASGLSVESQVATVLTAIMAPIIGLAADKFGIAAALALFGGAMLLFAFAVNVREKETKPVI